MSSRYSGKIKVVCERGMCFPADGKTLEPCGTECYDPYPALPGDGAERVVSFAEYYELRRRHDITRQNENGHIKIKAV